MLRLGGGGEDEGEPSARTNVHATLAGGEGDVDYDAAADDAAADDAAADAALPPAAVPMAPPTPTCSWLATGMRTKMHMTDMQCTTH